jgi:NAD(P)-dependent dehydrogenase (short-subunit alcohol dehydrogenase family)
MFRDRVLEGQVVLITGGGTGLGAAMSERFGELGARLALVSRSLEHLNPQAEKLRSMGAQVAIAAVDVRDYDAVDVAVERFSNELGPITILVNNAAGNFLSPTERLSARAFKAVVEIVLNGTFHATLACGRRMIEGKQGGKILNIVTNYAWTGSAFVVPSASAKAGVLAMTQSLAVEWAPHHIRLNAIAPGPFPTKGAWSRLLPTPELEEEARARIPLGRFGRHEELTNLAAYLVSDYADYITGACVTIDGGQWLFGAGAFNHLLSLPKEAWDAYAQASKEARRKT